jgi:hypothetical protein
MTSTRIIEVGPQRCAGPWMSLAVFVARRLRRTRGGMIMNEKLEDRISEMEWTISELESRIDTQDQRLEALEDGLRRMRDPSPWKAPGQDSPWRPPGRGSY